MPDTRRFGPGLFFRLKRLDLMKTQGKEAKRELTDLEKADCLTGTMIGGIALKSPHFGQGKQRRLERF